MAREPKHPRFCTTYSELNRTIEDLGGKQVRTHGSHIQWEGPKGRVTTLTGGEVRPGTRASIIRMLIAAGLLSALILAIHYLPRLLA